MMLLILHEHGWFFWIKLLLNTWVIGLNILILSGNCALVTRKVDICLLCNSSTSEFISGYMIGSPTSDNAQCRGARPSSSCSCFTPVNGLFFILLFLWCQDKEHFSYSCIIGEPIPPNWAPISFSEKKITKMTSLHSFSQGEWESEWGIQNMTYDSNNR